MNVHAVDERDVDRENSDPRFRVFFFTPPPEGRSFAVEVFETFDADVLEVIAWAREDTGRRPFAVGLVGDGWGQSAVGITWIYGGDPNELSRPRPEWVERTLKEGGVGPPAARVARGAILTTYEQLTDLRALHPVAVPPPVRVIVTYVW